jgi:hypothetical protein
MKAQDPVNRLQSVVHRPAEQSSMEASRIGVEEIRRACLRALWDPTPTRTEMMGLIGTLEGYIRELAPVVAALVPRMQQEAIRKTAIVVLRNVDEVLEERESTADVPRRLHDVGVVARALLATYEHPGELVPSKQGPSDSCGWRLSAPPRDPLVP